MKSKAEQLLDEAEGILRKLVETPDSRFHGLPLYIERDNRGRYPVLTVRAMKKPKAIKHSETVFVRDYSKVKEKKS